MSTWRSLWTMRTYGFELDRIGRRTTLALQLNYGRPSYPSTFAEPSNQMQSM